MTNKSQSEKCKELIIKSVLEGIYPIGSKLPPERELSEKYSISRISVHTAIVALNAKGLVKIIPRRGVTVNDYKRYGSIEIIDVLFTGTGVLEGDLLVSLMNCRKHLETEYARLAANYRTKENLDNLKRLIETDISRETLAQTVERDFRFHHEIALATGNSVYPLFVKSMETSYKSLITIFYGKISDKQAVQDEHKKLYAAIKEMDAKNAQRLMDKILDFGEKIIF